MVLGASSCMGPESSGPSFLVRERARERWC